MGWESECSWWSSESDSTKVNRLAGSCTSFLADGLEEEEEEEGADSASEEDEEEQEEGERAGIIFITRIAASISAAVTVRI